MIAELPAWVLGPTLGQFAMSWGKNHTLCITAHSSPMRGTSKNCTPALLGPLEMTCAPCQIEPVVGERTVLEPGRHVYTIVVSPGANHLAQHL